MDYIFLVGFMYLKSYAKINLVLEVLSKREDNYHNISSIFSLVDIYDDIYINLKKNNKWDLVLDINNSELLKDNILFKLINELNEYKSLDSFLMKVKIIKRIPIGGGLGGGSANAASVLFFLFIKNVIDLKLAKELALKLGADVLPIFVLYLFKFLYKKDILVLNLGKQDIVIPLNFDFKNPYNILFIFPNIKVLTKDAFLLLNKTKNNTKLIGDKTKNFIFYLKNNKILDYNFFYNEFEEVVFKKYSNLNYIKELVSDILIKSGVKDFRFLLSGSGSTLLFFIPKKYNKFINLSAFKQYLFLESLIINN
ncbi:MAG: 4-(cytidine 5'-diphospho)-2-C-methyl-D-erythritol kinase [bacterium]